VDEINFGPKHDFRLPSRRWLIGAAAIAMIAVTAAVIITGHGGHRRPRPGGPSTAAAAPARTPAAAPGTLLLTCDFATAGFLGKDWRAGSLKAGPLWLVSGRQFAHLPRSGLRRAGPAIRRPHRRQAVVMIVEVSDGSTVVIQAPGRSRPYFRFVDGFNGPAGNPLPAGDTGFTLSSCPNGDTGPNGPVTDFRLGFFIEPGRAAPVDIRASASAHPIRLLFTSPRPGHAGSPGASWPGRVGGLVLPAVPTAARSLGAGRWPPRSRASLPRAGDRQAIGARSVR
jgi:hypothetical protein